MLGKIFLLSHFDFGFKYHNQELKMAIMLKKTKYLKHHYLELTLHLFNKILLLLVLQIVHQQHRKNFHQVNTKQEFYVTNKVV